MHQNTGTNTHTHTPYKEIRSSFKSTAKTLQPVSRDDYYTALVKCVFLLLSSCDFTVWSSGLRSSWEPGTRIHKPNNISDWKICIFYQLLVSFAKVSSFSYNLLLPLKSWLLFLEAHQVSKQIKHYPPSTAAGVSVQLLREWEFLSNKAKTFYIASIHLVWTLS